MRFSLIGTELGPEIRTESILRFVKMCWSNSISLIHFYNNFLKYLIISVSSDIGVWIQLLTAECWCIVVQMNPTPFLSAQVTYCLIPYSWGIPPYTNYKNTFNVFQFLPIPSYHMNSIPYRIQCYAWDIWNDGSGFYKTDVHSHIFFLIFLIFLFIYFPAEEARNSNQS